MNRLPLTFLLLLAISVPASAGVITADQIATPFNTSSAPTNSVFDTASLNVFIDPANTNWMALSIGTALRTDLPNLSNIPTIQSAQMDDAILLTASIGGATSSQIILDDNNAFNQRVGNQAIFYGFFNSVGSFNGFSVGTYGAQPESGALTSFFDAHGAGTYTLNLSFFNRFQGTAGHSNVFLLRDVQQTAVPEPSGLALASIAACGLACCRRRRRRNG